MDQELMAMIHALEAVKELDRAQWTRVLNYISTRMAEDNRRAYSATETHAPTAFVAAGNWDERSDSADESAYDLAEPMTVLEVNGIAVASQRFVVAIVTEWFDTREAAEKYLASMLATDGL